MMVWEYDKDEMLGWSAIFNSANAAFNADQIYSNRFRFRSSCWSSSGRSAVSAGLSREWTLLAMLERRVAGSDDS
jgi:hypothetical protein